MLRTLIGSGSNNTGNCLDMFKVKMILQDYVSRQRSRENCKLESFRTVKTSFLPFFFDINITPQSETWCIEHNFCMNVAIS